MKLLCLWQIFEDSSHEQLYVGTDSLQRLRDAVRTGTALLPCFIEDCLLSALERRVRWVQFERE